MTDDDFEALKKVISDAENMKYYEKPYDDSGVTRWINWCKDSYQKNGFGLWAVILKETQEMIGDCGISMQFIDDEWKPEIGYHLRLDYHRQGLGKEMTQAVRDYFFAHFDYDEVYSYMNQDNIPSIKTAEANGMTYLHLYKTKTGEICCVYRITRQEWERLKMNTKLIMLTKEYEKELGEMIDEWRLDQEINHTNHSPWAIFKNDYHDFDYYLENLDYKTEDENHVPSSTFFLLDIDRNRLVGAVNIRHHLNERLLFDGGHIGDGIRPSERRKGYGTEIIRLALLECKKLGIDKVLITCDKDNVGSMKSIINNGGILENEVVDDSGSVVQRYWVKI